MAEHKIPRVVDVNGYVLNEEEVRLEWDLYRRAGVSFLCPVCRGTVGTGDYREFVRRRTMFKPEPHHFTKADRIVVGSQQTEDWEKSVREVFASCPFCGDKSVAVDVQFGRAFDYVSCPSCQARWQVEWKGVEYEVASIALIEDSVDKKGKDLLWRVVRPAFWKDITMNPMNEVTAQDALEAEKDLSRETRERVRTRSKKARSDSIVLLSTGLVILGIGYVITAADRFFMIPFILLGAILMLGGAYGIVRSTRELWDLSPKRSYDKMIRDQRRRMEKRQKQTERFDGLLLVECPKCHNRYDRFLIENCPDCGTRNPKFRDIWKKDKTNTD